jgi:hypothetical protein
MNEIKVNADALKIALQLVPSKLSLKDLVDENAFLADEFEKLFMPYFNLALEIEPYLKDQP